MIYVMSDLHGEYEKHLAMLEKIRFSDEDELYVLGDVIDRGPRPVALLQDLAIRENVYPLLGNHEWMAKQVLPRLCREITDDPTDLLTEEDMQRLMHWQLDGGDVTLTQLQQLPFRERAYLIEFLAEFMRYDTVVVGKKTFHLVHAGLGNYRPDKPLCAYTDTELVCCRPDFTKRYFASEDTVLVCGHTPTQLLHGKSEIYHAAGNICMDCGATFGGKLGCLCLNTMEEFYV